MLCYFTIRNCSFVMIISGLEKKKSFVSVVFILLLRECECLILLILFLFLFFWYTTEEEEKEQKGDFDVHFLSTRV